MLITQLPLLLTRHVDPRSGTVLVWGAVQAGEAPNAIPQHGVLRGTLRTGDHATWEALEHTVRTLVEHDPRTHRHGLHALAHAAASRRW